MRLFFMLLFIFLNCSCFGMSNSGDTPGPTESEGLYHCEKHDYYFFVGENCSSCVNGDKGVADFYGGDE